METAQQRLEQWEWARTATRNRILSLFDGDVIEILLQHLPPERQALVDQLEYLLARDDQLVCDIANAKARVEQNGVVTGEYRPSWSM